MACRQVVAKRSGNIGPAWVPLISTWDVRQLCLKTKTLVNRLNRGVYEVSRRPESTAPRDDRGPVVRTVETAQTFLAAAEVDALVGDYLAGMGVKALAERYGTHRATVFSHLSRRNVPSRRPGLGLDEKVEAVRLA